jgi:uncharacterized protein
MYKKSPSKVWRKFNNRYSLTGVKSKETGKSYYPPVLVEKTGNTEFAIEKIKKAGKLITWSQVTSPPEGFEDYKPYIIGIIEFENGERTTAQIVESEFTNLKYGDKLVPVFRKYFEAGDDGIIHYGLKWRRI